VQKNTDLVSQEVRRDPSSPFLVLPAARDPRR